MASIKHRVLFLGWVSLVFLACSTTNKEEANALGTKERQIENRLLQRPLIALTDQWVSVFENDSILLIRAHDSAPSVSLIRLEYITDSSSTNHLVDLNTLSPALFQPNRTIDFDVYKVPKISNNFNILRFVGLDAGDSLDQKEVWKKSVTAKRINQLGRIPCEKHNTASSSQLDHWVLSKHLNQGIFFTAQNGYNLLLVDKVAWVIYNGPVKEEISQMLHFIEPDQPFENYSFRLSSPTYENCVGGILNNSIRISRIQLKKPFSDYEKIRIGQFTPEGNDWVQTIKVARLQDNKLLRYDGELR